MLRQRLLVAIFAALVVAGAVFAGNEVVSVTLSGASNTHGLIVWEGTGTGVTALAAATNGQIPIGSTGADPVLASITAGTGIGVVGGAGTITINNTLPGNYSIAYTVTAETSDYTALLADNGTFFDNAGASGLVVITLPASPTSGIYYFFYVAAAQTLEIKANGNSVTIQAGPSLVSMGGGNVQSSTVGSLVQMVCIDSTHWACMNVQGKWAVQ